MKTLTAIQKGGLLAAMIAFLPISGRSQPHLPDAIASGYGLLDSWSFSDTNWLSDYGFAPLKLTNIVNVEDGGDGNTLWIDTTNLTPAFLFYRVVETSGTTNINCASGSLSFWFNPDWSSTNQGGTGPGDWANLISLGQSGTNGTPWWAFYLSPDGSTIYFSSQTNGGSPSNYLSAPVSLDVDAWYNLVLTYGPTNSALYLNGAFVTNGTGVAYWPGTDVTFFSIGSDSNGYYQAEGMFDDLKTYNYQLNSNIISGTFAMYSIIYGVPTPSLALNTNAPASPSTSPAPRWFSGSGSLTWAGYPITNWSTSYVWFSNMSASLSNGGTTITFTIGGGSINVPYDVFGTALFVGGAASNSQWVWLGEGYPSNIYTITNIINPMGFFVLGTDQDSKGIGITDAYQLLVSKTDPNTVETDGLPNAWIALNGLVGSNNLAIQDPDMDGLNNAQEYLYGTKPLVGEGTNIWVGNPSGFSGLP